MEKNKMDRNFWEDMRKMRRRMNQYFTYPDFSENEDEDEPSNYRKAWAEFSETENSFIMNIEIPGVNKEDIKVNLTDNAVEIRAEKKSEKKEETKEGVINYARGYAGFYRMISLPVRADVEGVRDIHAVYRNGVLKLEIPKKKPDKKDKKEVRVE